ncbi:M17 family metallopeptidase [Komagataeibacter sp. FNDCR2]|uniref:leucyl aminopeptidase family protein n=1 Tax=Komagataeibacter sp. FNDCR2 TaxID=2878682 RepID=UPI001E335643|nr:leucyl aminopeptidase family protein [Komagataeibacter sp. FNDCR2]MCE2576460.1 leucyl aminopeptidase family protein [Komagataeibacter sp. FNDCR2]
MNMLENPDCLVLAEDVAGQDVGVVHAIRPAALDGLGGLVGAAAARFAGQAGFVARYGQVQLLPGADGNVTTALLGVGEEKDGADPFVFGALPDSLPPGLWRVGAPADIAATDIALGFCLGAYRMPAFGRDMPPAAAGARLVVDTTGRAAAEMAQCMNLARSLINTPPNLMGPDDLAIAAAAALGPLDVQVLVIRGARLEKDFPTLCHVGGGSERAPCVVEARWHGSTATDDAPLISLAGKGVCFDTGGYDLKSASSMLRMKKDMGGAAIMLALARLIVLRDLPVRLELRLGCVENSVSGRAMRPSDVVTTRSGLTVEIGNTDAEGRLVLCDLLHAACEHQPDLLVDAATLTGAARVALGPDVPALFANDDAVAAAFVAAGHACGDPLWRLPLWPGYRKWLSSPVADLNNISSKPTAGAITAALFLENFVRTDVRWIHIDTYGWNDVSRPGRPEGGESLGLRAAYEGILNIFNIGDRMHR